MSDINEIARDLRLKAKELGKDAYQKYTISDLAINYCSAYDSGDSERADIYFSALLMRFWGKINKLYVANPSLGLEREDYYEGLVESILYVCKPEQRIWEKKVGVNVEQAINQVMQTHFIKNAYYNSNLLKNKGKNCEARLDGAVDEEGEITLGDTIEENTREYTNGVISAISMVQGYINQNRIVEAIIMDHIAFKEDVFRVEVEEKIDIDKNGAEYSYNQYSSSLWKKKLIQALENLDNKYADYFMDRYRIKEAMMNAAQNSIIKANKKKKRQMIENTLSYCKSVEE